MIDSFYLYDDQLKVKVTLEAKKNLQVVQRILQYCKENNCISGETLHQSDECILAAPEGLSDIIDDILEFESEWIDN